MTEIEQLQTLVQSVHNHANGLLSPKDLLFYSFFVPLMLMMINQIMPEALVTRPVPFGPVYWKFTFNCTGDLIYTVK